MNKSKFRRLIVLATTIVFVSGCAAPLIYGAGGAAIGNLLVKGRGYTVTIDSQASDDALYNGFVSAARSSDSTDVAVDRQTGQAIARFPSKGTDVTLSIQRTDGSRVTKIRSVSTGAKTYSIADPVKEVADQLVADMQDELGSSITVVSTERDDL